MKLEDILGLDFNDPMDRHAQELVHEDQQMLDAVIRIRERSGRSQTDIAVLMGVSPSAVSRIESGERDPHLSTLRRYALAVGAVIRHDVRPLVEVDAQRRQAAAAMDYVQVPYWRSAHAVAWSKAFA